jgi:glycosyltransferase involved in cell wall biosynthesis
MGGTKEVSVRVLQLASVEGGGGAGRAAQRLHRALRAKGVDSAMKVDVKTSDDPTVLAPAAFLSGLGLKGRIAADQVPVILAGIRGGEIRSPALVGGRSARSVDAFGADAVNVHWTGFGFMSLSQLDRVRTPMVWTLHDMWSFLGAEHYAPDDLDAWWTTGSAPTRLERWTWQRKRRHWSRPQQLVAPSRWLAGCVSRSALLGSWPVRVIPNPLDVDVFRPLDRTTARSLLGLPSDVPLIMFGTASGLADDRKGWDLLSQALPLVAERLPEAQLVVLGHRQPPGGWNPGFPPAHWLGLVNDDLTLSLAYSAADVVVVPSRLDNLPQMGTEAQSCGCPVVAFDVGGLDDVVDHLSTGYLAQALDVEDLAAGIVWSLADQNRTQQLRHASRDRAVALWSPDAVIPQYLQAYADAQSAPR